MVRLLVICWVAFVALTALTFVGAYLSPGAFWIPKPWILLVLSLVLICWTLGALLRVAVHTIGNRLRQR